ncbi:MAG: hypothetical protein ACPGXL_01230 [Chitinophagales bacterium]
MSGKVFQLIHKLTPTEKRYYIMFASMYKKQGELSKHLVVFKNITKYKINDNKTLKKHFQSNALFRENLSQIKNYLYNDIIDCLVLHHRKKLDQKHGYFSVLRNAILLDKDMVDESVKSIESAKAETKRNQMDLLFLAHTSLLRAAYTNNTNYLKYSAWNELLKISEQRVACVERLMESYEYEMLYHKVKILYSKFRKGDQSVKDVLAQLSQQHPLLQKNDLLSTQSYLFYINCLEMISHVTKDYEAVIIKIEQHISKFNKVDLQSKNQLILLYNIYTNLIGLIKMTGNEKKLKIALDHTVQIHKAVEVIPKQKFLFLKYYTILDFVVIHQSWGMGQAYSQKILHYVTTEQKGFNDSEKMVLYVGLSYCFWGLNQYNKILHVFSKIFPIDDKLLFNPYAKFLYCIANIQQKNYQLAKSQCNAIMYVLQTKSTLDEEQTTISKSLVKDLKSLIRFLLQKNKSGIQQRLRSIIRLVTMVLQNTSLTADIHTHYVLVQKWAKEALETATGVST